ncbi:MAG TPA: tripartite tricarboxylate transporter permease, partial [Rhizobiaceae bacterium]|nr:tripartite tricarboxylate transporter permease [Rhizobiaceae bacterium]
MDLIANLGLGFDVALTTTNILYCFVGVLLGTLVGVLPGIGPTGTVAILLPITFTFEPVTALIMLAGIYYGAQYGGSTSAILINLPGESSSAVTAIDGHQMARQGRAGPALATAAIGSFFAGSVATLLLAMAAPPLTRIALQFGSAEYFSLIVLGLVASVALAHGSIVKALAMIVLGLLFGMVGQDLYSGQPRFTFGFFELYSGINFVSVAVGVFGVAEILRNLEDEKTRTLLVKKVENLWLTKEDLGRIIMPILRATGLGSLLGILPGGGHVLAAFASYSLEKKLAKNEKEFGKGAIEGVAGPEAANNAAAQTSFIPLMTLGIPAHPVMALIIGAFIIHGITPGPNVITDEPALFWGVIVSMWVGNLLLVILNLPLVGLWVRLLTIPYRALFPAIIAFACIGTFSIGLNAFDIYSIAVLGIVGYVLVKLDCEPAPLLLGFVLGPL